MKYLFEGKNIQFVNRRINNWEANQKFIQLTKTMDTGNPELIEFSLHQFVKVLKPYVQNGEDGFREAVPDNFHQINDYIENHIHDKFCLEELSEMANINKYGFAKKFRASTGMSPMNYILMKKIFSCKKQIDADSNLSEMAYRYHFSDLAHFSKTFKHYVGISPKAYQKSLSHCL